MQIHMWIYTQYTHTCLYICIYLYMHHRGRHQTTYVMRVALLRLKFKSSHLRHFTVHAAKNCMSATPPAPTPAASRV